MNLKKSLIIGASILTLAPIASATFASGKVYADEALTSEINEDVFSLEGNVDEVTAQKYMPEEDKTALTQDVMKNHPSVSEEFIREAIDRQLAGDYTIPGNASVSTNSAVATRSNWQGITVDQMGALIDTAIGTALGAGVGGVAAAIKSSGKKAAKGALKKALVKYGLVGSFITETTLDYVLNLTSPGTQIAKYWDQNDSVPSNGRINF